MRSLPIPLLPLLLPLALLAGCATDTPRQGVSELAAAPTGTDAVWHRVRFHIHWNRAEAPAWHIDALLAHRVIGPLLAQERKSIALWRFHRRAADDAAGHSFSFLTYAPSASNETLCRSLKEDGLVQQGLRENILDKVECENFPADKAQLVEGSSDSRWSPAVQRAWPHYIMGVSEMWLRLIDGHLPPSAEIRQTGTLEQMTSRYETANRALTETWQHEGEHALLHHLSGIFGYEPLQITEKKLHRF